MARSFSTCASSAFERFKVEGRRGHLRARFILYLFDGRGNDLVSEKVFLEVMNQRLFDLGHRLEHAYITDVFATLAMERAAIRFDDPAALLGSATSRCSHRTANIERFP